MSTYNQILEVLRREDWPIFGHFVLPMALSIAMILATGPYLQHILYQPIELNSPSISDPATIAGVVQLPNITTWISYVGYWPFLLVSLAAAYSASKFRRPLHSACAVGIVITLGVTLQDIILDLFLDRFTILLLAKNVIANLIGGILMAILSIFLLFIFQNVKLNLEFGKLSLLFASITMLFTSLILSFAVYYGIFFLFQKTSVSFNVKVKSDVSGTYKAKVSSNSDGGNSSFSFLPRGLNGSQLKVNSPKGAGKLKLTIQEDGLTNRIEIRTFSDCFAHSMTSKVGSKKADLSFDDVEDFSLSWDEGQALIEVSDLENATYKFLEKAPTFFWYRQSQEKKDDKNVQFSTFVSEESVIQTKYRDSVTIFINLPLMKVSEGGSAPSARNLNLNSNGKSTTISFPRPEATHSPENIITVDSERFVRADKVDCRRSPLKKEAGKDVIREGRVGGGVVITVRPNDKQDGSFSSIQNSLEFENLNGWAAVKNLSRDQFKQHSIGAFSFISLSGQLDTRLDGQRLDERPDDEILISGKVYGSFSKQGELSVSGSSDRLWRSGMLVNRSIWDKLDIQFKIALLGWLGAMLWVLRNVARKIWNFSRNEELAFD